MNHSGHELCRWEKALPIVSRTYKRSYRFLLVYSNTFSHWLSPYPEWSLNIHKTLMADAGGRWQQMWYFKGYYHPYFLLYITFPTAGNLTYAMSKYKWAPVSWSGVAAFHLAACVCTSSNDKELIRPVCSLMCTINSFHIRLMLHH